ncbi:MAG: hypothetical protein JWQ21_779 [Herminiimonas sp.]|nr:hypothetical protein [Herminiimonas sp.]
MNKQRLLISLLLSLAGFVAACDFSIGSAVADSNSNSTPSSSHSSAAAFTGKNGRVSVNGDMVQAKNGVLTINGVSYGTVNDTSVIRYSVRNNEKVLSVDGIVRKPVP